MARTNFSGPVYSDNGFVGSLNTVAAGGIVSAGFISGAGAPGALVAPKGSLYVNTTATTTTTRLYINTDGAATWATFTASA